jgi:uncharacterized membrane protein (UPF0127 family)
MKIINKTRNVVLAENAVLADTVFKRLCGLLGREKLGDNEALILKPSNSIHMFFMRFAIDALFVDKDNRVIAALSEIRPWRLSKVYWKSYYVVELSSGVLAKTGTSVGDEIALS